MKIVMRFGKNGDLSPRCINPFEVLDSVGPVAYKLALPLNLSGVHLIFPISMLKRHHGNEECIVECGLILLDKDLQYEEEPVEIFDQNVQKLRLRK